jgi:uncharacterized protein
MPRVVHFEIAAADPERAAKFYGDVFGWELNKWSGPQEYWLITTGADGEPGINGGMLRRQPQWPGTVNTVGVPNVDDFTSRIERHGGKTVVPKMAIQGVGWLAYCQDPEGNVFGIIQPDTAAK